MLFQQKNPLQPTLPDPDPDSYFLRNKDNEESALKQQTDLDIIAPKYANVLKGNLFLPLYLCFSIDIFYLLVSDLKKNVCQCFNRILQNIMLGW